MAPTAAKSWLAVDNDGTRLRIRTSEALVARRRFLLRLTGACCAVAGLVLVTLSPWTLALTALGILAIALAPRVLRRSDLVEVDLAEGRITPLQSVVGRGQSVPTSRLRKVFGAYEVYGWDPRSTLYAETDEGKRVPILVFVGTHEDLAEVACELLGEILGVEATYAGAYGPPKVCFKPDTADSRSATTDFSSPLPRR